jgi:hypothetical protein
VYIFTLKPSICKKLRSWWATYDLPGWSHRRSIVWCMCECRPPLCWLAVCGLRQPIGDATGQGEVESGKCGRLQWSPPHYHGGGEGGEGRRFSYLRWVLYNLPSWSTRLQELARNTVKTLWNVLQGATISVLIMGLESPTPHKLNSVQNNLLNLLLCCRHPWVSYEAIRRCL